MHKRILLPVLSLITCTIISCGKYGTNCSANIDCSGITYSGTIKPLVNEKCGLSGCHAGQYTTYNGLSAIANSGSLYQNVVATENMPAGGVNMTCEQRAQIECWINAGAPNN
ncbi:MAG: hypothetical protein R2794_06940 [Chitinophagales bacterium]